VDVASFPLASSLVIVIVAAHVLPKQLTVCNLALSAIKQDFSSADISQICRTITKEDISLQLQ
jgi:hypothetical protein